MLKVTEDRDGTVRANPGPALLTTVPAARSPFCLRACRARPPRSIRIAGAGLCRNHRRSLLRSPLSLARFQSVLPAATREARPGSRV